MIDAVNSKNGEQTFVLENGEEVMLRRVRITEICQSSGLVYAVIEAVDLCDEALSEVAFLRDHLPCPVRLIHNGPQERLW